MSREITCKAPSNAGPDPDANICKGLAPGTKVNGYDIGGRASEGSSVNKEGLATFFQGISASSKADAADDYGKGGWRLFTVAEGTQGRHSIVFSYISQSGPRLFRNALVVDAVKDGANWKGRSYVSGLIFPQEMPALLAGGDQANSKYSPWNPAGITLPAAPGFYFSATVAIKGGGADCVNVRTTPSKTGPVGECVKDGAQYSIIGGPTDADGLKWWNTQKLGSQQTTGWIAADFLAIQKQ